MGKLHVIVQGLFVVDERSTPGLELIFPDVPGHVHRIGSWLAETPVQPGALLELRGTSAEGSATFQGRHLLKVPNPAITPDGRAATIRFPHKPVEILGLLLAKDPLGGFVATDQTDPKLGSKVLATVFVLIFDFPDEKHLELHGHHWEPYSVDGSVSLHLISTSIEPEPKSHDEATNQVLKKVYRDFPGYTFAPRITPPDWRWAKSVASYGELGPLRAEQDYFVYRQNGNFAFSQRQLESYDSRYSRLALMGRLVQERRGIENAWNLTTPIGKVTSNCVGTG